MLCEAAQQHNISPGHACHVPSEAPSPSPLPAAYGVSVLEVVCFSDMQEHPALVVHDDQQSSL
jgi:hypothetical protein